MQIWDLDTLQEKARPYNDLYQKLVALAGAETEYRISETVTPQEQNERDDARNLIRQLGSHEENGELSPTEYERLCLTVCNFLFSPHLHSFQAQTKTSDGSNRYDFICRIKSGHPFWDSIRADFRTRSVLFECKNYSEAITADQVYSTERYLFAGALRTVCFLISRKGPDEGCRRAAQGALRESGKLVLLLSNKDLIEMLRLKTEKDDPTNYLDEKIWQFITTLPR